MKPIKFSKKYSNWKEMKNKVGSINEMKKLKQHLILSEPSTMLKPTILENVSKLY
jgi:hypothetical protein